MTVEQLDKISAQRLEDVDIDTLVEVNSIKYAGCGNDCKDR